MGQRTCTLCHKRPRWRDGACKRCWHKSLWPDRPAARSERRAAEHAAAADPLANYAGPLVYDGYLGTFRAADPLSLDSLDLEAVARCEEEHGAQWDPDREDEQTTSGLAPREPARACSVLTCPRRSRAA